MHDKMFTMSVFPAYEERAVTGFLTFFFTEIDHNMNILKPYICVKHYMNYI